MKDTDEFKQMAEKLFLQAFSKLETPDNAEQMKNSEHVVNRIYSQNLNKDH